MRYPGIFLPLLAIGLSLSMCLPRASAQEDAAAPAPAPQPAPAVTEPPPYSLDLPELHPSANGNGLFPSGSRQNTPATTSGANRGNNRRNPFTGGTKERGRARDRTLQKADSDPLEIQIAYRRHKTEALARDPELSELQRRADAAGSDVEKRAILREYYKRLFAAIGRLDSSPGMKAHIAALSQVASQRYDPQRRVVRGEENLLTGNEAFRGRLGR